MQPGHEKYMRLALRLAERAAGQTSPNPMVGAVLVKGGRVIGRGWHHRAGEPHAEIEASRDAQRHGHSPAGATLYVTLEPCSTHGRTPPCTEAIIRAGIGTVVAGATDPNPQHCGKGFAILERCGIEVLTGVLPDKCERLNEAFNHWIKHRTPLVTVKAALTLDGKIATASGESKWITGEPARKYAMKLRSHSDAILVGVNTILADDPNLTVRDVEGRPESQQSVTKRLRRIVLDSNARTPLAARVISDEQRALTTVVVGKSAPKSRVRRLAQRVNVLTAPSREGLIDLRWLLSRLGAEDVLSLLVEGGGEVNASFLLGGLAHRIAFFYAPKVLGGFDSRKAVAGIGAATADQILSLRDLEWCKLGSDWLLTARCDPP
jgi:diaminohydroxyphosphoribosylaminopyrimidine deaminase / 5-amino-6-(5-phosphoribosylamino)uracil reductase